MTHSHDTSTPATSAETVPSEEFVLVPREPTPEMLSDGEIAYHLTGASAELVPTASAHIDYIYRAMIGAAPNLSASHLAKEGGETVVVPYDDFHAAYGFVPRSKMSPDQCLKTRLRLILREEDLAHVDEAEAIASLPQPSPALAKGGDAVREALRNVCSEVAAIKAFEFEVRDVVGNTNWAVLMQRLVEARAALSTPTEGPASAEDWLRGMARMSSYPVEICQKFEDLADLIMERHNATA